MKKFESLDLDTFKKEEISTAEQVVGSYRKGASTATNIGPTGNHDHDYSEDETENFKILY